MKPIQTIALGSHELKIYEDHAGYGVRIDGGEWAGGMNAAELRDCVKHLAASYSARVKRLPCPVCGRHVGLKHGVFIKHNQPAADGFAISARGCPGKGLVPRHPELEPTT